MEYFVRRAGRLLRTRVKYDEEQAVPLTTLKDCTVYQTRMNIGDRFVPPGIVITQKNGTVSGKRPSGSPVFSFETDTTLEHFVVDKQRLFALDRTGKAHIYHFNGTTPEVHDIHRHALGWCVVPNTRMMVTWNVLTLRVSDPDTNQDVFLKGHQARVTACAAASSTVASGDSKGTLCIWYVASWKRFHSIQTGATPVEQIVMTNDNVAVRTRSRVQQYDTTTGKHMFDLEVSATSVQFTHRGLVVAHDGILELFVKSESAMTLEYGAARLLPSVHSRTWCVKDRHLVEVDLSSSQEQWPGECLRWIREPRFPFTYKWPTHRYMDALALAVEEWLPKVETWEPPRTWFRHGPLKQAIWKWCAEHNVLLASDWMFLPDITLRPWFELCMGQLARRAKTFDYASHTMRLLEHVYRRKRLVETDVLKWCWFHHGKMRMRGILLHLTDVNERLMNIVAADNGSPTAIMCFRPQTVADILALGFVCTFVRLLNDYHCRFAPSDETRKVYQRLTNFVFTAMDDDTCDIPMPDTGAWKPVKRFMPTDVGSYIKTERGNGFVTRVVHAPGSQVVHWQPLSQQDACELKETPVEMWTYHCPNAPHTMLECALTLMDADKWARKEALVPFTWFESEVGAFHCLGQLVRIFDQSMRVVRAVWDDTGASIETTTSMVVRESEQLPILVESDEWSYVADGAYDLTPLRIKVAAAVSKKRLRLPVGYASVLLSCCPGQTMVAERRWDINIGVTAATSDAKSFVVGMKNGCIYDFDCVASFAFPKRSFQYHSTSVLSLHMYEDRLLSLSDDKLCIWCLKTGTMLFAKNAREHYMTAVPYVAMQFWILERGDYTRATLWDIEDEIPLRQIQLPKGDQYVNAFHVDSLSVLVSNSLVVLWSEERIEHEYTLDLDGTVTCLCETPGGIAGGTSGGSIFMLEFETQKVTHWASLGNIVTTAMAKLPGTTCLVLGDAVGHLTLWNASTHAFESRSGISSTSIEHIFVDSIFAFVVHRRHVKLVSIVQERGALSCHSLYNIITWSPRWQNIVLSQAETHVKPVVKECLRVKNALALALDIVEICSEEYSARTLWCDDEMVDLLLDTPAAASKNILKRLVAFKGPRIDCPICGDDGTKDTVSFLPACHHRFHTKCIHEHIQKTPEWDEQMQYEYALTVALRCPTCRTPFKATDVKIDHLLNCT